MNFIYNNWFKILVIFLFRNMKQPLMPIATAVWLVENTTLTFAQIAKFCVLHEMEVQGIADGEIGSDIEGQDPILLGQLSHDNIKLCENDEYQDLQLIELNLPNNKKNNTGKKYIPIAKRRDKPDAIAWLIKNHPNIPESKIVKLIGTTKKTILAIKSKDYTNFHMLQPKDPVLLGLCTQMELNELIEKFTNISEE